jgi:hypothetical protein
MVKVYKPRKAVLYLFAVEFRTMDDAQKRSGSECYMPRQYPLKCNIELARVYHVPTKATIALNSRYVTCLTTLKSAS